MELFNHNIILPYSYSHKYQFFLQLQHVDSDIVASFIECEDFFFFDITSSSQDRTKQILLLGSQGGSGSLNERKTHVDISARRSQDDYDDEDEEDRSIAKFSTLGAYTMDRSRRCSAPRRVPRTFLWLYNVARRGGVPPSQANRETKEVEVS